MLRKWQGTLVVVVAVVWAGAAHAQGLVWESTTTGVGDAPQQSRFFAMPKMMRIVTGDGRIVIIRGDKDAFYAVDPTDKTYTEFRFADLESAAASMQKQMTAATAQMQKRLKDLPPEQRAQMEKMMAGMSGVTAEKAPAVTVTNAGETRTINGYRCTKYVATENGKAVLTAWTTTDVKGFEALREDWIAYQKRLTASNNFLASAVGDAYSKIEGFPMQTEMGDVKSVVTKVESRTTPASEFEVPPGYRKNVPEFLRNQGKP